jgi:hypothetical protein
MMIITGVAGQDVPLVSFWRLYEGGPLTDLDATPSITITRISDGAVVYGPSSAGVTHPGTGTYGFTWQPDSALPGGYYLDSWTGLYLGDAVSSDPEQISLSSAPTAASAAAIGITSTQNVRPIMSVDMFKFQRRRGVSLNLVPQGTEKENDAALAGIIQQATDWMFGICLQTLHATVDTVRDTVNVNRDGYARIYPRYRPIIAVTGVSFGADVEGLQAISNLAGIDVQTDHFAVPTTGTGGPVWTSQGPLQFGAVAAPMFQALVQYSYVNGYPHTWLTEAAAAGATQIAVADTTGIIEGNTYLTIYSGAGQYRFLAGAVSNAVNGLGTGPGYVACAPLPAAVANNDVYPTFVSAMPGNAIEAGALAIRSIIKSSSVGNVAAGTTAKSGAQTNRDPLGAGADLVAAEEMLYKGGFVVPQS